VANQRELSAAGLLELARAYHIDPMIVLGGAPLPSEGVHELEGRRVHVVRHGLEEIVRQTGLSLSQCGCAGHCELVAGKGPEDRRRHAYEPAMGRDLFAGLV
jgi:hypothetical protein